VIIATLIHQFLLAVSPLTNNYMDNLCKGQGRPVATIGTVKEFLPRAKKSLSSLSHNDILAPLTPNIMTKFPRRL